MLAVEVAEILTTADRPGQVVEEVVAMDRPLVMAAMAPQILAAAAVVPKEAARVAQVVLVS